VVVYVNAVGHDKDRRLLQHSYIKKIYSAEVLGRRLSAIQLSTSAGAVAMLELFAQRKLAPGFVSQESVPMEKFLETKWGGRVYAPHTGDSQRSKSA
jgi:saccharopine dehydrogenase-like NADP-dependent oxidoreductase